MKHHTKVFMAGAGLFLLSVIAIFYTVHILTFAIVP